MRSGLEEKLATVGIKKLTPETVIRIMAHIKLQAKEKELYGKARTPDYPLYHGEKGGTSQRSIKKIRDLMNEAARPLAFMDHYDGLIGLMMDEMVAESHREQNEFTTELFFNKATGDYQLRQPDGTVESWDIPASVKELLLDLDAGKYVETVGTIRGTDGPSRFLLEIVNEAERLMGDKWQWSFDHLERDGILEDNALNMLEAYDALKLARMSSEISTHSSSRSEPGTHLRKFRGLESYLSIHYVVILNRKYPCSPFKYVEVASYLYARGLIAGDVAIYTSGEDILRYAIWKGEKHREAYNKSLRRYRRTPKARARLEAEIDALLKGIDDE